MASSKLKMPPAIHQKRAPEEPACIVTDFCIVTALKKLKVDDGSYVKKAEDQSKASLKHKTDSTTDTAAAENDPANQKDQASNIVDIWSESLKKFCLCDEEAFCKRGSSKWKSMCRYHKLRMRKESNTHKNNLNLAQAVRVHKPLLQESRFKVSPENKRPSTVLRSARFSFEMKSAKLNGEKSKSAPAPANSSEGSKSAACDKTSQDSTTSSPKTVFAKAASEKFSDFSSLVIRDTDNKKLTGKDQPEPVPSFPNFRDTRSSQYVRRSRNLGALWPGDHEGNSPTLLESNRDKSSSAAAAAPLAVPQRVDLAVERSCSQEARLDEVECSVNELAAYFDHYFVIPKEMSSMAQMMYT